jgi:lipopolysaccharide cholinephosphotransferase
MNIQFDTTEEVRNGVLVTSELKKIWKVEIELLVELLKVCKKHNLKCWVEGGTLLGAVRHKGFIPWDDDIDVLMMRDDYDKLMKIGPSEFHDPYFFQSAYTDKYYFHGHVQIRNRQTTAVRPEECNREFNQGIFIDIFPLDGMPESKEAQVALKEKSVSMRRKMARYRHFHLLRKPNIFGNWIEQRRIDKEIDAVGYEEYYRSFEDMFRSNIISKCQNLTFLSSFPLDWEIDKHIFDETLYMDFETIKVPIPAGYDKYLRMMFGDDYMTPKRIAAYHGELVFDTEKSYIDTLPAIRTEWRKEGLQRVLKRFFGSSK